MQATKLKIVDVDSLFDGLLHTDTGTYLAGMPQLAYVGLSENWLLKECGHRHWMGLAGLSGKQQPNFHDINGNKSYAAFTAVRISSAKLNNVAENQAFTISSQVSRAGQARHFSMHDVKLQSVLHSNVQMLSTFVFRREAGNNQSVTRANFADSNQTEPIKEAKSLMQQCKKIRTNDWVSHMGIAQMSKTTIQEIEFLPCPNSDFNGANFLYFASFQAFVDRAEWAWACNKVFSEKSTRNLPNIVDRDLFFYGNINVGDTIKIRLCAQKSNDVSMTYWCEVYSGSGLKIADVFTHKEMGCND